MSELSFTKKVARAWLGFTLLVGAGLGAVGIQKGINQALGAKDLDITSVTESLHGFDLYLKEILTLPLPSGIPVSQIALEVSEGKPANLKNPNPTSTPYYNTIYLLPQDDNTFTVLADDSAANLFKETESYTAAQISQILKTRVNLEWLNIRYRVPSDILFRSDTSPGNLQLLDNALNNSIAKGYHYEGSEISLGNRAIQINSIKCGYSVSQKPSGEPYSIANCRYGLSTNDGKEINLNITNSQGYTTAYLSTSINSLDPIRDYNNGGNPVQNGIQVSPNVVNNFLQTLKPYQPSSNI